MTKDLTVAFRVDSSFDIGTGHVMRCLTLADALTANGAVCRFICREHPGHLIERIRGKGYRIDALPAGADVLRKPDSSTVSPPHAHWLGCHWETDAAQTKTILKNAIPDWLIVDHYALDESWEKSLQECSDKLMVIDDLADRPHACNLLIDQNLGRERDDYAALVPASCKCLIGPQYALLRPEFAALRANSLQRRQKSTLKRLLLTMGGVDKPNATAKVLEALKSCPLPNDCQITVVMGARTPWLEQVRAIAETMPWPTELRVDIQNMALVMADSDLAIGAAGSTSWERCCLGLPTIIVILAANQQLIAQSLEAAGATKTVQLDTLCEELRSFLEDMLKSQSALLRMSDSAAAVASGTGADQVVRYLTEVNAA